MKEPGPTGSCWRLHYSLRLPELYCDHFELTDLEAGESFKRWQASANEVLLADRAYAHREVVGALLEQGVKVVVRFNGRSFPLLSDQGRPFRLLARLRRLQVGQVQEWSLRFGFGDKSWPIRLCAIRKSHVATQQAQRKARRKAQLKQRAVSSESLQFSKYILVLTNLEPEGWSAPKILELYRCRWQIELAFKRLKGALKAGASAKKRPRLGSGLDALETAPGLSDRATVLRRRGFFPPGATELSLSRWMAWQEMTDSVLMTLHCPLALPNLIRRGPQLRWRLTVYHPKRPLQMEHVTRISLS